jgi:hypothetical protein
MMLTDSNTKLERSHNFVESNFDIGDPIIIMEYLRKNAYSNPKRAICQEIMSNARDAHREAGVDAPIEVKVPSRLDPTWVCRDYGIGISPSRMENVFIKFGKSTKRNDNTQTGGFGIGAKTPWAYSDTFIITTVCDIEGHRIKYNYAAVIGENRIPKLVQMADPTHTDEPTGTTISFNVDAKDHYEFCRYTLEVTRFWKVRPIIKNESDIGDKSFWSVNESIFENDGWSISKDKYSGRICLIDSIPYNLNLDAINDKITEEQRNIVRHLGIILNFNVGELSVSLNREALYYDDKTVKHISSRLQNVVDYLRSHFEQKVSHCKTLWEAAITLASFHHDFQHCAGLIKNITWNGQVIPSNSISGTGAYQIVHYTREPANHQQYPNRVRRFTANNRIDFRKNSMLVIGDSKTRIEHAFANDKTLVNVYVVCNRMGDSSEKNFVNWMNNAGIGNLGAVNIDTLPLPPKQPRVKGATAPYQRVKTYIFQYGDFRDTEIDAKELKNGSGIYVPCFRRLAMTNNKCDNELPGYISIRALVDLCKIDKPVYGIQKDLLPRLGSGWVSLYDYTKHLFKIAAEKLNIDVNILMDIHMASNSSGISKDNNKILEKIASNNLDKMPSGFLDWYNTAKLMRDLSTSNDYPFKLYGINKEAFNIIGMKTDSKFVSLDEKFEIVKKNYIFADFSNHYGRVNSDIEKHLLVYLEAMKRLERPKVLVA